MSGPSGVRGLLAWCRAVLTGYPGINIRDMSTSWRDGRAFCAIINKFRPDLINFSLLSTTKPTYNCHLAFSTAEKFLGIPRLLDVSDIVDTKCPDQLSVMTYVSLFYHKFYRVHRGLVHSLMFATNLGPEITDRENQFIAELERYRANEGLIYQELSNILRGSSFPPPPPLGQPVQGEREERANIVTSDSEPGEAALQRITSTAGRKHKWKLIFRPRTDIFKILFSHFRSIFRLENFC